MKKDDDVDNEFAEYDTLTYTNYSGQTHHSHSKQKTRRVSSFSIMLFSVAFLIVILATLSLYGIITDAKPFWGDRKMGVVSQERLVGVRRGFLNKATDKEMATKEKRKMKEEAMLDVFADGLEKQEQTIIKANEERVARRLSSDLVGQSIDNTINRVNMAGLYDGETVLGEIAKDLNRPREQISNIYLFTSKANDYKEIKATYGGNDFIVAIEIFERREQISRLVSQLE